tara:strand:- start:2190 stop:2312 length:123 start_codon:yes stop_codon:yes gene_type:complete
MVYRTKNVRSALLKAFFMAVVCEDKIEMARVRALIEESEL